MLREGAGVEILAGQIRAACERVDSLYNIRNKSAQESESLSDAFQDLFILLEQLRLAEKEIRIKNEELMSVQEIMEVELQRYRELFEVAPDGYVVTDRHAAIQQANRSLAQMLGVPIDRIAGLSLLLFIPEKFHAPLRSQMTALEKEDMIEAVEITIQPKNGETFIASLTIGAIREAQSVLVGLHWLIRDISRQKKTEEALKISEERFRSVADSATDAIIVADERGRILSWNKGAFEMFGYTQEEVIEKPLSLLVPERFREAHDERNLSTKTTEFSGLRKDGSEFPVEVFRSAWTASGKKFFTSIFRDITERKLAEETRVRLLERVLAAQEEDRRWIARELHDETGQSLSSLLIGLRMIEEARTLKKAKIEAGRLRMITAQTLDELGRLAKGLRPIILDDLGLVVALKRHISDFAQNHGIEVDYEVTGLNSGRLPLEQETALFRIAQEALTNVAKHAEAKSVKISLKDDDCFTELIISDNGKGFDAETVFQAAAGGNHFGIHGMKERAALLNGTFEIRSVKNEGTTIRVLIKHENTEKNEKYF